MNRQEFLDKINSSENIELEYAHEFGTKEKEHFLNIMKKMEE